MTDETELAILMHLRNNSRNTIVNISKGIEISQSSVLKKIKDLEKTVITKHTAIMDYGRIGYPVHVAFVVKAKDRKKVLDFLSGSVNVNTLYRSSLNYDFYAECLFRSIKEMYEFKDTLESLPIDTLHHHFLIEEVLKEHFLTKPEHISGITDS